MTAPAQLAEERGVAPGERLSRAGGPWGEARPLSCWKLSSQTRFLQSPCPRAHPAVTYRPGPNRLLQKQRGGQGGTSDFPSRPPKFISYLAKSPVTARLSSSLSGTEDGPLAHSPFQVAPSTLLQPLSCPHTYPPQGGILFEALWRTS